MLGAVVFGHEQMQIAIKTINDMVAAVGKPKWDWKPSAISAELDAAVASNAKAALSEAYLITEKQSRYSKVAEIKAACTLALAGGDVPSSPPTMSTIRCSSSRATSSASASSTASRASTAATRPPCVHHCQGRRLPRTHGSALFTRGETQALVVTTLGTGRDAQIIDALEGERREPFMFH